MYTNVHERHGQRSYLSNTVFPPIAAGDGFSHVKDPALIFSATSQTWRLLEEALIGGTGGY